MRTDYVVDHRFRNAVFLGNLPHGIKFGNRLPVEGLDLVGLRVFEQPAYVASLDKYFSVHLDAVHFS